MQVFLGQTQLDETQPIFTNIEPIDSISEGYQAEYTYIKDQIVKKFFEQYDANKLKIILNMFGCKNSDCPRLIDICSIDYVTSAPFQKRLIQIGEKNYTDRSNVTDSIINNSTSETKVKIGDHSKEIKQQFRVNISKIDDLSTAAQLSIPFTAQTNMLFNFSKKPEESYSFEQSSVALSLPMEIDLEPCTQMNYSIHFAKYKLIIYYLMSFELHANSVIKHPHVPDNSASVVFMKTPLIEFLTKNVAFIQNIKYPNSTAIKLQSIDNARFKLDNFPTNEEISSEEADFEISSKEKVLGCGETTTTSTTTTTTTTSTTTTKPMAN